MTRERLLGGGRALAPIVLAAFFGGCAVHAADATPTAEADALFRTGEFSAAAKAYAAVTAVAPEDGAAWFGLGQSVLNLKQYDRAIDALGKALALGHRSPGAMFGTARAFAAKGEPDAAVDWLERMAATGSSARLRVVNTPELAALAGDPRFDAVLEALRPCRAPEFREFDFWIGDWDVSSAGGRTSRNRISAVQGGCVILEEYETPTGYTGVSLSFYDATKKKWHQTWMDNQGQPIYHEGGMEDGAMVLVDDPAASRINRTTWTPLEDGAVRQHWQASTDGGKTWSTVFDGRYTRVAREDDE